MPVEIPAEAGGAASGSGYGWLMPRFSQNSSTVHAPIADRHRPAGALSRFARRWRVSVAALCISVAACSPTPQDEPLGDDCRVTDGDTIRCGDERIRLLAIDAPEMAGKCRKGRICVAGDPDASKRALERLLDGATLTIHRTGTDRYDRTLGIVYADDQNLSCAQIAAGHAEYMGKWDDGGIVAAECPDVAG